MVYMNITATDKANEIVMALSGRLDTTSAPDFQEKLMAKIDTGLDVVLDFEELAYVSSAGLRVLLMGEKAAKSKDISMRLTNVSADIMEVFEMTGFDEVLKIEVDD
jgi:anti-anti-sigma factor